jgi:uncharacterized membrane protein YhfC
MATAGVCILVAAAFMWRRDFNTAFVVAVIGAVAWFLNYRIQMKGIAAAAEAKRDEAIKEQNDEDTQRS